MTRKTFTPFVSSLVRPAAIDALRNLDPRVLWHNPVMFVVYAAAIVTTGLWVQALSREGDASAGFILTVSFWLWFTVLFANFAEALTEGRSKAQAAFLKELKKETWAKRLREPRYGAEWQLVHTSDLRRGDVVVVEVGDLANSLIPVDGEVIEGVASVDESAITGESAPVIREAGGDFSAVTGGTRVISDWMVVRITANPGETFIDRMIAMVENAKRQKTPNEVALSILLVALTMVFYGVIVKLLPYSSFIVAAAESGTPISLTVLVALLVCLIPTTIANLLSAVRVAGMSGMRQANVIATSGRAVEAAGDVDVLLLDKTGTITSGNRHASAFLAAPGVKEVELADAAQLASLADETPEGRSIVRLTQQQFDLRQRDIHALDPHFLHFSAHTRMSGVDMGERQVRKGAAEAIRAYVESLGGTFPPRVLATLEEVARRGSTPLVVAEGTHVLGVIELKYVVEGGIKERFAELRRMGVKTVMVTGDKHMTAATIAAEAGVDDFLAEATPDDKLALVRRHQSEGRLVAMAGDGAKDAPALAQADVAVVMNSGTQAAKEAGNMVDLDSTPTKLIEVVETGKQMRMARGSLTLFAIANDIAKYFAVIPAAFVTTYPELGALNVMGLASPNSAILSTVIFNALIIVFLIPLALKGLRYRPVGVASLLPRNLLIYGLGGVMVPFIGIKLIDIALSVVGLA
ncbi:potassium-transporting ATPase subunit KdpB [Pseudomonas sp. LFM046]|uniref:potassium-transporting ATPase subunit KdpB n=1 Tax=Pseudomonas sp. LFM046 TaxID=1608357 RepID=UPI0005CFE27F|nr:potassium-transporting ATPase subunit KdpB [Pseudomonas sp. LFM046]